MKYDYRRKVESEVEAVQVNARYMFDLSFLANGERARLFDDKGGVEIVTGKGKQVRASDGEWFVWRDGELGKMANEDFIATYESVDD